MKFKHPSDKQTEQKGSVVLYQPDETIRIELIVEDNTVWLTQRQMAELFGKDRTVIGRHIQKIYRDKELEQGITCAKFAHMGSEGDQQYGYTAYNLEVIIALGQRIKSQRGLQLKQWFEQFLSETRKELTPTVTNNQLTDIQDGYGEIVIYQPDDTISLEVRMGDETVWLTQGQIIELFQSSKANISEHIKNIYEQGELNYEATVRNFRTVQQEGGRMVERIRTYYNLDAIISVGFRVNAKRGIKFRQWANVVIKNYIIRGYAINQQLLNVERHIDARLDSQQSQIRQIETTLSDHQEKIDFFVRTSLPPVEGVFYDGQIFDAHVQISGLIKQARNRIVLVDNYIDETTLTLLNKRDSNVDATIYTRPLSQQKQLDVQRNNQQYPPVTVIICQRTHDRFLIIDDDVYAFGASLKDAGKKLFAYIKMKETSATELLGLIR